MHLTEDSATLGHFQIEAESFHFEICHGRLVVLHDVQFCSSGLERHNKSCVIVPFSQLDNFCGLLLLRDSLFEFEI